MEKPTRILYAEDNQNDIELALAAFEENDMAERLDIVHDGREAIDYLYCRGRYADRPKSTPAFILLDIKMPGLDGIEVLKIIRNSAEFKNLPIVMLTSSRMESDITTCYMAGANGFVVKPINFDDFVQTIKGIGYYWAVLNTSPCRI